MNVQEGKDVSYDYRFIVQLYDAFSLDSIKKDFVLQSAPVVGTVRQ